MIGFGNFGVLTIIGALCALDTVSVAQAMVSRPLVSATLAGAALGRADQGLVVGALLELFALETMPFGASRYPEWGSAGVVAAAAYVIGGDGVAGSLALATLAGLVAAGVGSWSMVLHRKFVARAASALRDDLAAGSVAAVVRLHTVGIASDLWRGALVTAAGLIFAVGLATRVLAEWHLPFGPSVAIPIAAAVAVGLSSTYRSARATPQGLRYLAAGVVAAALILLAMGAA